MCNKLNFQLFRHKTRCIRGRVCISKIDENSPTCICYIKKFAGAGTPGTLELKGGEEGERGREWDGRCPKKNILATPVVMFWLLMVQKSIPVGKHRDLMDRRVRPRDFLCVSYPCILFVASWATAVYSSLHTRLYRQPHSRQLNLRACNMMLYAVNTWKLIPIWDILLDGYL